MRVNLSSTSRLVLVHFFFAFFTSVWNVGEPLERKVNWPPSNYIFVILRTIIHILWLSWLEKWEREKPQHRDCQANYVCDGTTLNASDIDTYMRVAYVQLFYPYLTILPPGLTWEGLPATLRMVVGFHRPHNSGRGRRSEIFFTTA